MTDYGALKIAEAIKFLGVCLIRAAFVHKSPANFDGIVEKAQAECKAGVPR